MITIPLSTNVAPTGTLRVILRYGKVEVHYAIDAPEQSSCGTKTIGIDKGYSEVKSILQERGRDNRLGLLNQDYSCMTII